MPTTKTSAAATNAPRFQLLFKLNSSDNAKLVSVYLRNDLLKHEIEKLKLEQGTKFESLFTVLAKNWEGALTLLANAASTVHEVSEESGVVQLVARRLRRAVEKHRTAHPQEVKNEPVFYRHLQATGGVVVEAVYEIGTGRDGAFAPALFGTKCEELAAKVTQKKRVSEKDLMAEVRIMRELFDEKNDKIRELKAMNEETRKVKDAEIASLSQQLSDTNATHEQACKKHYEALSQLKASQVINGQFADGAHLTKLLNHYRKKSDNAELEIIKLKQKLDGMEELRAQLERATLSKEEARSALGELRGTLKDEKNRFKSMRERLTKQVEDLKNQVKVEEAGAKSAMKHIDSMPDDD